MDLYLELKQRGASRSEFLRAAAQIKGIYVPSLYDVTYHPDGTVSAVTPKDGAPAKVEKRIIADLDKAFYPETFVVPFMETVHDRAVEEVLRGLYPWLPLLPGRISLPSVPGKIPGNHCAAVPLAL